MVGAEVTATEPLTVNVPADHVPIVTLGKDETATVPPMFIEPCATFSI